MKKSEVSSSTKKKTKEKKINTKFITICVLFVVLFSVCLFFATKTTDRKRLNPINYSQTGNIEYKVFLNKNEFYTEPYLEMNKSYVASLIDYIDINYDYLFSSEHKFTMDFDYKIIGELVIENSKGNGRYLEKEYTLLDTKKAKMIDDKKYNIKENIKIDYAYYNQLANSFKSTYGVDINSYLNVYLDISPKTVDDTKYKINENNKLALSIPLSEKAIEIQLNASNQNIIKQIVPEEEVIYSTKYLVLEIIFLIPSCYLLVIILRKVFDVFDIYTPYDKYVKKTLKEYDRLIVETDSKLDKKGYNVIQVKNFIELLDARDNLNLPIIYLNTKEHHEGIFYIISNKDIYLLTVDDEYLGIK